MHSGMLDLVRSGNKRHRHVRLSSLESSAMQICSSRLKSTAVLVMFSLFALAALAGSAVAWTSRYNNGHAGHVGHAEHADDWACDTVQHGYQCRPAISHYWGSSASSWYQHADLTDSDRSILPILQR